MKPQPSVLLILLLCVSASSPEPLAAAVDDPFSQPAHGGLTVHLGCGDGAETLKLPHTPLQIIHGIGADRAAAAQARRKAFENHRHGDLFFTASLGARLPYDDRTINTLVVTDDLGIPRAELERVLAPLGTLWTREGTQWTSRTKPWPDTIDEWTHYLHNPTNNALAADVEVGPPNHLKWIQSPRFDRHHDSLGGFRAVVSAGGRIFSIEDAAPSENPYWGGEWVLRARDAFNGLQLWTVPIPEWSPITRPHRTGPVQQPRRLVAIGDRVYVTLGHEAPVSELDARTGDVLRSFNETDRTQEIIVDDGILYAIAGDPSYPSGMSYYLDKSARFGHDIKTDPGLVEGARCQLLAIDLESGKLLWNKTDDLDRYWAMSLGVEGDHLTVLDENHLTLLHRANGKTVWQSPRKTEIGSPGTPVTVVLGSDQIFASDTKNLDVYDRNTGKKLWSTGSKIGHPVSGPNVFLNGGKVWANNLSGFLPESGELAATLGDPKKFEFHMAHARCYRPKATTNHIITARFSTEYLPFGSDDVVAYDWLRGTCQYGLLPGNGLTYATPTNCECAISGKLYGFHALSEIPDRQPIDIKTTGRLTRGPAYGKITGAASASEGDWPAFRRDHCRGNAVQAGLADELSKNWAIKLGPGPGLTQPVASGDTLLVLDQSTQTIHALDPDTGTARWTHHCPGRVDSPPTIHGDTVLFGDRLGYLHALRLTDGATAWTFHAAPEHRFIGAWGSVESTWPVHGAVLIVDDHLVATAGRTSYLDGGIHTWALDPATGDVLSHDRIFGPVNDSGRATGNRYNEKDVAGCSSDILSSDGRFVYLRHKVLDAEGRETDDRGRPHVISSGGFLDHSRNHRTGWTVDTKMGYYLNSPGPDGELIVQDGEMIHAFQGCETGRQTRFDPLTEGFQLASFHMQKRPEEESHLIDTVVGRGGKKQNADPAKQPQKKRKKKSVFSLPDSRGATDIGYTFEETQNTNVRDFNAKSMLLSDGRLILAGTPNERDDAAPYDVIRGTKGALLRLLDEDHQLVQEIALDVPVCPDGMSAANGRLFLVQEDGTLSSWK